MVVGRVLALGSARMPATIASGAPSGLLRAQAGPPAAAGWRQWGGPNRDFLVDSTGLADAWPEAGPRALWAGRSGPATRRSSLTAAGSSRCGRGQRARTPGSWQPEKPWSRSTRGERATIWEHSYPSKLQDFSYSAGPHSTPLIVGDRLFTIGTNKEFFAFDTRTGKVIWSHDSSPEFHAPSLLIRPVVKARLRLQPDRLPRPRDLLGRRAASR